MRAGYVPQDEQQVYVSRGAMVSALLLSLAVLFCLVCTFTGAILGGSDMPCLAHVQFRQNVPKCPGFEGAAGEHSQRQAVLALLVGFHGGIEQPLCICVFMPCRASQAENQGSREECQAQGEAAS